jgi:hypothetical protein
MQRDSEAIDNDKYGTRNSTYNDKRIGDLYLAI